jgi:hypothetical protein
MLPRTTNPHLQVGRIQCKVDMLLALQLNEGLSECWQLSRASELIKILQLFPN